MSYIDGWQLKDIVKMALKEDLGIRDITTELIVPKDKIVKAILLAKDNFILCGLNIAGLVLKMQDERIKFKPQVKDGKQIRKGRVLAKIEGRARPILTAERVALNFLSLLSGIATKTHQFVKKVKPYKVKIMDTRKTIPGLRLLEKYAVRIGGGFNHRMCLDEMILVKDNHLQVLGGYKRLRKVTEEYQVELEVKNLREFKEALKLKPDIIMLDNMSITDIKKAVKIRTTHNAQHAALLEASGGITLKNVKKIASTGVDIISIGELTHSSQSVDISLEIL